MLYHIYIYINNNTNERVQFVTLPSLNLNTIGTKILKNYE